VGGTFSSEVFASRAELGFNIVIDQGRCNFSISFVIGKDVCKKNRS